MREIVIDTETTGLDPSKGHRVIEVACLELHQLSPTGQTFHAYLNPERDVPHDAMKIHGIKTDFLKDKPLFSEICIDFLNFIEGAQLVIHNAAFDLRFLNAELQRCKKRTLNHFPVIDTLQLARQKFPGAQASLEALCRRFGIDDRHRTQHGALVDAELLAKVYMELIEGKQTTMTLEEKAIRDVSTQLLPKIKREPRQFGLSKAENEKHQAMIKNLQNALWSQWEN